jgi:A/G-specific adenine glycosylase
MAAGFRATRSIALLPGIGRSTANSIATFCFGAQAPILDGNVKRVLCRAFGIEGFPGTGAVEKQLWALAGELMPKRDGATYNQAQMDLGATVCTRGKPRCDACPLADICVARHGSHRRTARTESRARTIPQRETTLLVLRHGDRVLLEARPPAGIWGGLLSLPELPAGAEAGEWAAQRFACRVIAVSPAPTLDHAFSHFRLRITPLLLQVEPLTVAMEPGLQWVAGSSYRERRTAGAGAAHPRSASSASGSKPLPSRKR